MFCDLYQFIGEKETKREKQMDTVSVRLLVYSPKAHETRAGSSRSKELNPGVPTGTQFFETISAFSQELR